MTTTGYGRLQQLFTQARRLGPGERSAFLDQECGDDAGLRREVEELLAAHADADDALGPVESAGGARFLAEVLAASGEIAAPVVEHPERIGKYRILRLLGEGGMGYVYEAEQEYPKRRVALKVVRPTMVTRELLKRFRLEAQVLAQLQHPGIAQIYEAGADEGNGPLYFAMELVEGQPIDQYARKAGLDTRGILELVARLCDVLEHAHRKGIVHRDLKPSNILVVSDAGGRPRPKILDFGVARARNADVQMVTLQTTVGQLVGTVPYMSPEQASGDPEAIDLRSDVYAVGVIAFEMLTGRMPYQVRGKLVHEAVRIIQEDEPSHLSSIDRALRGDVETIVAKALEKDRARRYPTTAAMAADIRRFLDHQPIEARPASTIYQLRKFARRNKAVVVGAAATLIMALAGAGVATRYAINANQRADELERSTYLAGITAASAAVDSRDFVSAAEHLETLPEEHRGWEYAYLRARLTQHSDEWLLPAPVGSRPVFSPDGSQVFAGLADGSIARWDAVTGARQEARPRSVTSRVPAEAVSYRMLSGRSLRYALPSERGIVFGSLEDGADANAPFELDAPDDTVIAWNRSGDQALLSGDGISIWDGRSVRRLSGIETDRGNFHPSGRSVVLSEGHEVVVVDATSGAELGRTSLDGPVMDLAFSPDGRWIAVAGHYRNTYLLDAEKVEVVATLFGHAEAVHSLAWAPDSATLVTSSLDGTVREWSTALPGSSRVVTTGIEGPAVVSVSPDGRHLLVGGERLRSFPLRAPYVLRSHESYVYQVAVSADARWVASAGYRESGIRLWDVRRPGAGEVLRSPQQTNGGLFDASAEIGFTADSRFLVAGSGGAVVKWDVASRQEVPASLHPDMRERYWETLGRRYWQRVWNQRQLSPDGRRLATYTVPGTMEITDAATDAVLGTLVGHEGIVYCAAFSPDGTRIATGGNDATVRIWDAQTFEQLLILRGHDQYVMDLEFSADGTLLASASGDRTVRLWDTLPLHERRALAIVK